MLRKQSEAVSEGNGPVPQQVGSGEPLEDEYWRKIEELFKILSKASKEIKEDLKSTNQRVARLEQDARQPRLAMIADGQANTKTRESMEDVATAVQAMNKDSYFADRVDLDPMSSTSFGDDCTGPPAPPCSGENALVGSGAAPKSCLPFLEMPSPTAAGGLPPTGEASIARRTTFNQPTLELYSTEETIFKRSSTPYVSYDSSFFQKSNLPAAPSCRRVIETKSGENRMFDPGGSQGRLHACPCLGSCRALLLGRIMLGPDEAAAFFVDR